MKIVKVIILALLLGFMGFIIYCAVENSVDKSEQLVTAKYRDIETKMTIAGVIQPLKEIEIKSTISGVLDKLYVQIGDEVKYGQPIARIKFVKDPLEYKRLLKDVEIAEIRLSNAKSNFNRTSQLYKENVIATEEYENEYKNLIVIKKEYLAMTEELEMVDGHYKLNDISNIISATADGTILELPIKEGGSVMARGSLNEGTTVAKIANLQSLIFKGDVLESDVLKLKKGTHIEILTIAAKNMKLSGIISHISPKGIIQDGVSRFEVTADMIIPEHYRSQIRAGYTASGDIILEMKKNVLSLEEKYIQFNYDSAYVIVINQNGKYQKQFLKTGISDGIYTEIISGIDSISKIKIDN